MESPIKLEDVLPDMTMDGMSDELAYKVSRETERLLLIAVESHGIGPESFDPAMCKTMKLNNGVKMFFYDQFPLLIVQPVMGNNGLEFEFKMPKKVVH